VANAFKVVLDFLAGIAGNYGWAVIIMTVLFRLLLCPLDVKQKKTMRKQAEIQPKLAELQKKYGNDKEKLSKKQMELYKKENFSPMSGCLPMLIQLPIFIIFFNALRLLANEQMFAIYETMKSGVVPQLEGWLWIRNIWQADSIMQTVIPPVSSLAQYASFAEVTDYETVMAPLITMYENVRNGWCILPALAGVTSFLQTKLTSTATDNKAASADPNAGTNKVMKYLMTGISVFFCMTSNSVFALYWCTSNIVSIITYYIVDYTLNAKEKKAKEAGEVSIR